MIRPMLAGIANPRVYATWDAAQTSANITLSGGNLVATNLGSPSLYPTSRANIGVSTGKWYWEILTGGSVITSGSRFWKIGVANASAPMGGDPQNPYSAGTNSNNSGWNSVGYANGGGISFYRPDLIGVALDVDARTLSLYKNGVFASTIISVPSGALYPFIGGFTSLEAIYTANFGATPFTYTPPSGYNAGLYQ